MVQLPLFFNAPPVEKAHISEVIGNTRLVEHGIFQDESQWRIHLSIDHAYIFPTQEMRKRCETENFTQRFAFQGKYKTAKGFTVPVRVVSELKKAPIAASIKVAYKWPPAKGTSLGQMGRLAEAVAKAMIEMDLIVLPRNVVVEDRLAQQYSGVDLVQNSDQIICQVKCDLGVEKYGNLYIQTHECNPYKQH